MENNDNGSKKIQELRQELISELNKSYIEMVDDYADENSNVVFGNSSLSHARYITLRMFERAKENIFILSGKLDELYFDNTIKEILPYLASKVDSIKIITLQETDNDKIVAFKEMFSEINKKVKTDKKMEKNIIGYIALKNSGDPENYKHFYIIDERAWREEAPHKESFDPEDIRAEACFNDTKTGKKLAYAFMELWNRFAPINAT